jgi:hypothetical protein
VVLFPNPADGKDAPPSSKGSGGVWADKAPTNPKLLECWPLCHTLY